MFVGRTPSLNFCFSVSKPARSCKSAGCCCGCCCGSTRRPTDTQQSSEHFPATATATASKAVRPSGSRSADVTPGNAPVSTSTRTCCCTSSGASPGSGSSATKPTTDPVARSGCECRCRQRCRANDSLREPWWWRIFSTIPAFLSSTFKRDACEFPSSDVCPKAFFAWWTDNAYWYGGSGLSAGKSYFATQQYQYGYVFRQCDTAIAGTNIANASICKTFVP